MEVTGAGAWHLLVVVQVEADFRGFGVSWLVEDSRENARWILRRDETRRARRAIHTQLLIVMS
jgi:hypothetical protein